MYFLGLLQDGRIELLVQCTKKLEHLKDRRYQLAEVKGLTLTK